MPRKLLDLLAYYLGSCFGQKKHGVRRFRRKYRLFSEIGKGGFGKVYQGCRVDGVPVAVKFVRHKHVMDWTLVGGKMVPSEICFMEMCRNCQGVVQLLDWFRFSSRHHIIIVMERPNRFMDLFDYIAINGRLDEATARGIFYQVINTVQEMSAKHNVVHRDIKDENIVLDIDTGRAWLCDFGSIEFIGQSRLEYFEGTRSYCPPEVINQKCHFQLEGAVWSLGILLYTMLVAHQPFQDERQICQGEPKYPSFLTKAIRDCLCPDPLQRITLEQLRTHIWLSKAHSIEKYYDKQGRWNWKRNRSFECVSSESEEDEEETTCSYRAQGDGSRPIIIPISVEINQTESTSGSFDSLYRSIQSSDWQSDSFVSAYSLDLMMESTNSSIYFSICSLGSPRCNRDEQHDFEDLTIIAEKALDGSESEEETIRCNMEEWKDVK